jgi:hypothetical protein
MDGILNQAHVCLLAFWQLLLLLLSRDLSSLCNALLHLPSLL